MLVKIYYLFIKTQIWSYPEQVNPLPVNVENMVSSQ
jgi:hypothetical protein